MFFQSATQLIRALWHLDGEAVTDGGHVLPKKQAAKLPRPMRNTDLIEEWEQPQDSQHRSLYPSVQSCPASREASACHKVNVVRHERQAKLK